MPSSSDPAIIRICPLVFGNPTPDNIKNLGFENDPKASPFLLETISKLDMQALYAYYVAASRGLRSEDLVLLMGPTDLFIWTRAHFLAGASRDIGGDWTLLSQPAKTYWLLVAVETTEKAKLCSINVSRLGVREPSSVRAG